jgi:hypothetical protein
MLAFPSSATGQSPETPALPASGDDRQAQTEPSSNPVHTPVARPALLLVDSGVRPEVTVSWTQTNGEEIAITAALPYGADADRVDVGWNVSAFMAVGGTRIGKGAGHPKGLVLRAGFYKVEAPKPFFAGIKPGSDVRVRIEGARVNMPVWANNDTAAMHLKYNPDDLIACGMPPGAWESFNLVSTTDTMNDRVTPGEDARMGVLDGSDEGDGVLTSTVEDDGSITVDARVPYGLFRNTQDPWQSDLPGTFLEPIHFHIEVELMPEGVQPLNWDALRTRAERIREELQKNAD